MTANTSQSGERRTNYFNLEIWNEENGARTRGHKSKKKLVIIFFIMDGVTNQKRVNNKNVATGYTDLE